MNKKIDILSLTCEQLELKILEIGEKKYRAKQIFYWLHEKRISNFSQMTNISLQLIDKINLNFYINSLNIQKMIVSDIDNTVKYLYELPDGEKLETVLMEYEYGNSLCVSTQVGCKMGCSFCASGIAGFKRNLTPSEILLQIYESERDSGRRADSIVLMGIGEPLDNFDNVIAFLKILSDKNGRNMSLRHVSLSTCGLCEEIDRLAELKLPLTLSISLHAVSDEKRNAIMPINRRYNIERLIHSCSGYFKKTGRRISFEYALIEGINDGEDSAAELIKLIKPLHSHINLIPINKIRERGYKKSKFIKEFQKRLTEGGLNATVRRTLGNDIEAACGQLRRESN
ncbi:MAG: 23S rRNA (adenine(2503)-C(2))-methyltransferase RlmN [Eubacterium sp.]|jgi:23S rRNA (adenine2503-C2)-methyltransferase|nr:23S rRNA (adenine(2503)-C(2))-methyltransferase RlmN [Eubacterium sp.]